MKFKKKFFYLCTKIFKIKINKLYFYIESGVQFNRKNMYTIELLKNKQ